MPAETSQTLDRGVRALEVLARVPDGLTVTELAGMLGVSRTVVYRLVTTLEGRALLRRDAQGRVFLGMGILSLAAAVRPQLRDQATPVLRLLAEEVGATACLTVADGGEALVVATAEPSWTELHVAYRVGTRHPLDRTASGRAMLLGEHGPAYESSSGELEAGAHGIAAPVRGVDGLRASVGIVALGRPLVEDAVVPHVLAAAQELAVRLG